MEPERSTAVLDARKLVKTYASGTRRIEVLNRLDLRVAEGEAVAVVGDSGVGKSTLLHILGGLDRPDAGEVRFRGADVYGAAAGDLAEYRNRQIGFVFQFHHLLPEFTALENVEMPLRISGRDGEGAVRAAEVLERIGLADRARHYPAQMSGGEQQRVAIARAVASGPAVVLADEPTGNLDPRTGVRVFQVLRELRGVQPFALVLATHSERLARGCDRVLRLVDGRLAPLDESETRDYFDGVAG